MLSLLNKLRKRLAMSELREELREFAYDGLVQLKADLEADTVLRGTWDGCVLSYRRGHAGSADCDRNGRRGNTFTRFWDGERITPAQVLEAVQAELEARRVAAPEAAAPTRVVHVRCEITPGPADEPRGAV